LESDLPATTGGQLHVCARQLESAQRIGKSLQRLEQEVTKAPTLEGFCDIRGRLDLAAAGVASVSHLDLKQHRINLEARIGQLRLHLENWKLQIQIPAELLSFDACEYRLFHFERPVNCFSELAQFDFLLVAVFHVYVGISRRDGGFLINMLLIMLDYLRQKCGDGSIASKACAQIPRLLNTVLNNFNLEGQICIYAVCVECHANYPLAHDKVSYPAYCSGMRNSKTECYTALLDDGGRPLKIFTKHVFEDYLAGLLSCSDVEHLVDQACNDINKPVPNIIHNPLQSSFLRGFIGPDKEKLFLCPCNNGEACLVFLLCVDFFNAEGMKTQGAKTSVGIIAMACMNLPLEICYKPENLYLAGIVPGPSEPLLMALNHYIDHVVDNMLQAWHTGIHLSQTALHHNGRLVCCAISMVQ
jgi:hypothetical protein